MYFQSSYPKRPGDKSYAGRVGSPSIKLGCQARTVVALVSGLTLEFRFKLLDHHLPSNLKIPVVSLRDGSVHR